jgi:hypothetical protein
MEWCIAKAGYEIFMKRILAEGVRQKKQRFILGDGGGCLYAGCSKSPSSKAAASEDPEAYLLGYVEGLNDARTKLAGFFSILL